MKLLKKSKIGNKMDKRVRNEYDTSNDKVLDMNCPFVPKSASEIPTSQFKHTSTRTKQLASLNILKDLKNKMESDLRKMVN